jgi:hypothetical protein
MKSPLVSVCLPNLNTRPYLQERVDTIMRQTYSNWELVVSDNYSDDGAWEYFQELALTDDRVSIAQAPRAGLYANWNQCVRRARGEYVYIATSDDTMAPDCLEKLAGALDAHPDCDLAHCALKKIDERGCELPDHWSRSSVFALSAGGLLHRSHVRRAPFDGMLHLTGGSVYISITQLLIRRSLFDRIGLFETRWGSVGDFNWGMRAGLAAHTVHVPDTWGGWRVHGTQATAGVGFRSPEHASNIDQMIDHAIAACKELLPPILRGQFIDQCSAQARNMRAFRRDLAVRRRYSVVRRGGFIIGQACSGSIPAREYLRSRLMGRSFPDWIRRRLKDAGCDRLLMPVPNIGCQQHVRDRREPQQC